MDASLVEGTFTVSNLRSRFPRALILAVSVTGTDEEIVRCIRAGVDGLADSVTAAADCNARVGEDNGSLHSIYPNYDGLNIGNPCNHDGA